MVGKMLSKRAVEADTHIKFKIPKTNSCKDRIRKKLLSYVGS